MTIDKSTVLQKIREAFKDVHLEDGIGLTEATAIDNYDDSAIRLASRNADEKMNWSTIPTSLLNENYTSLSFFDAKGMRFHLPAFMSAELKGEYRFGMAFSLAHLSDYSKSQFSLLSKEQHESVKLFLEYLLEDSKNEFEQDHIFEAIVNYWSSNINL